MALSTSFDSWLREYAISAGEKLAQCRNFHAISTPLPHFSHAFCSPGSRNPGYLPPPWILSRWEYLAYIDSHIHCTSIHTIACSTAYCILCSLPIVITSLLAHALHGSICGIHCSISLICLNNFHCRYHFGGFNVVYPSAKKRLG